MPEFYWIVVISACCSTFVAINIGLEGLWERLLIYLQVFLLITALGSAVWVGLYVVLWLTDLPGEARRGYLQRKAEQRRRLGLCQNCGYDLRASEGRCPECGSERVT